MADLLTPTGWVSPPVSPTAKALREAHKARKARLWTAAAVVRPARYTVEDVRIKGKILYSTPIGPIFQDRVPDRIPPVMASVVTLRDLAPLHKTTLKLADIIEAACMVTGVSKTDFMSHRRCRALNQARFAAYYIAKSRTGFSYPQIGKACGRRDHTTIMNGVKRAVENRHNLSIVIAQVENLLFCGQKD